ncbi:MAG: argininosuccinate lyase [Nitrososphaerota archaeon]|nr:argininosuccinate lyase [Candidatus Bathyarchaeota archaeon]MDW8193278.1 argininosuccinate lyase [Nitrososphaerota archaeon]
MSKLLQGGRISKVKEEVVKFTSSLQSDRRLAWAIIKINQAHVIMLTEQKIIELHVGNKLLQALNKIKPKVKSRILVEDVHMLLEEKVLELCGPEVGGNLHIAKSRNDQVATAIRMELRERIIDVMDSIVNLQDALLNLAMRHINTIFPGYTHMQPAQPITFAHYLLSFVDCFSRDLQRLKEVYTRVNLCPMGAGALATSSFPVNRELVAELLGFEGIVENSLDAVGSRDFVVETIAAMAVTAVDISRLAQDLILFGSSDFSLIELPDEFSSTSSIMPQKKNPDLLEVIRARMSQILGNFVSSFSMLKALPSGYNLDFQEVTPVLWESLDIIQESVEMLSSLIAGLNVNKESILKDCYTFLAATELANMLVRKYKVPFRTSHRIVGSLVRELLAGNSPLTDVNAELLNKTAEKFGLKLNVKNGDVTNAVNLAKIVENYSVRGGPSPAEVERMISNRKEILASAKLNLARMRRKIRKAFKRLNSIVRSHLSSEAIPPESFKNLSPLGEEGL